MQTPLAEILEAKSGDAECCQGLCRNVFLRKAHDLTWAFVDSIARDGFIDTIKVHADDNGTVTTIRNGHHRLVAAVLLGICEVPTETGWACDSGDGPSGWPYGDRRKCYHRNPDPAVYIMSDPAFAAIVYDMAYGLSGCEFDVNEPYECCDGWCLDCEEDEFNCMCDY